jgi:hypothetical protein
MHPWRIFLVGSISVIAIWTFYGALSLGKAIEKWGVFGDKFGALNCLFSGLGYVAIVATLIYQHKESASKEREAAALMQQLERTAGTLSKLADQSRRQVEMQADIAMFEYHFKIYQYFAEHGPAEKHAEAWRRMEYYRKRIDSDSESQT